MKSELLQTSPKVLIRYAAGAWQSVQNLLLYITELFRSQRHTLDMCSRVCVCVCVFTAHCARERNVFKKPCIDFHNIDFTR